jgi:glutaredoxin-like protein
MALFDDSVKKQIQDLIGDMAGAVNILYFTQEFECRSCKETREFLEEFVALDENIHLTVYDLVEDKAKADQYGVDKIPGIVILDKDMTDHGIRFFGIPAGYEIQSFIAAIRELGGNNEPIPEDLMKRIKAIDKDVHIQVFVTPTCPYCPQPVAIGHRLALENEHVTADMVEATTFPELSQKYAVRGVPKIVINEKYEFVGSQPITKFLEVIEGINN